MFFLGRIILRKIKIVINSLYRLQQSVERDRSRERGSRRSPVNAPRDRRSPVNDSRDRRSPVKSRRDDSRDRRREKVTYDDLAEDTKSSRRRHGEDSKENRRHRESDRSIKSRHRSRSRS